MPENAPGKTAPGTNAVPEPRLPRGGQLVDASSAPFEWAGSRDQGPYYLQIALDQEFDDVLVTITAGDTTALTLYDTLEVEGEMSLYWRARAGAKGAWSQPAHFRAAGPERVRQIIEERDRDALVAAEEARSRQIAQEERVPVSLEEDSSVGRTGTAVILGVLVISFIVLLVILLIFGQVTYPAEAALPGG